MDHADAQEIDIRPAMPPGCVVSMTDEQLSMIIEALTHYAADVSSREAGAMAGALRAARDDEPPTRTPRVWRTSIPGIAEDVTAVTDRCGRTWRRIGDTDGWRDTSGDMRDTGSGRLIRLFGPVAEVLTP